MAITDKRLTSYLVLFVMFIFILQTFLVYSLHKSKVDLLQDEMSMVIVKCYSKDLGIRLGYLSRNIDKINLYEDTDNLPIDSENNGIFNINDFSEQILKEGFAFVSTIRAEQQVSHDYPIDVNRLDSLVSLAIQENNLALNFTVLLVDCISQNMLKTSKASFNLSTGLLKSRDIPLDFDNAKAIRLIAYPETSFYMNMGWILFISLVLSLACIFCFYLQLRALSRQRMLSKLKNDFFSDVSHELKQPLAVLRQALDSCRNEAIIMNHQKREHLFSIVESEVTKLDDKIKMIISLTMQEESFFELHQTDFDLPKIVFDLADEILLFPTKQIELNIENELLVDPIVYADKNHIQEVVTNLLGNAIKYSGNKLELTVKLYRDKKNMVFISVKDNGIGISKSDQKIIFEKYSRVDKNSVAKGSGIGLNYIKRVIVKHGGGIILNSELGRGSEFIVWLPQPKK